MYPWLENYFNQFALALNQGRMPNSIIIAGENGLGVNSLALEIATYYLCLNKDKAHNKACHTCRSCISLQRLHHSDLKIAYASNSEEFANKLDFSHDCSHLIVPKEENNNSLRRTLRVDTLRQVSEFLSESAMGGGGKVVIISDAHTMNESAANAILKTFEEPYKDSLIIMVTKSLELLLPTILSRASKIVVKEIDYNLALSYIMNKDNQKFPTVNYLHSDDEDYIKPNTDHNLDLNLPPITPERAHIALALNSYAPLDAMNMLLTGEDILAINMVKALSECINNPHNMDASELIEAMSKLSKKLQAKVLKVLILEILKYKAHINLDKLPLLKYAHAQELYRLKAKHLFKAHQSLIYIEDRAPLIPSRAPLALIRAWVKAFQKDKG